MKATISYNLSAQGQKASLIAGGNGAQRQEITIEPSDPNFARFLDYATIDSTGIAGLNLTAWANPEWRKFDAIPTIADILDYMDSRRAEAAKAQEAEKAKRTAETLAVLSERRTKSAAAYNGYGISEVAKDETTGITAGGTCDYLQADWPYNSDETIVQSAEAQQWLAELESQRLAAVETAKARALENLAKKIAQKKIDDAEAAAKEAARLARRAKRGLEAGEIALNLEDGCLSQVPADCWESHSRGKNWLATITVSPSSPGGLGREFATKAKGDLYYLLPSFEPGQAVEFGADYYSGSGRKNAHRWYGFVVRVVEANGDECGYVVLHKCDTGKAAIKAGEKFIAESIVALNG